MEIKTVLNWKIAHKTYKIDRTASVFHLENEETLSKLQLQGTLVAFYMQH